VNGHYIYLFIIRYQLKSTCGGLLASGLKMEAVCSSETFLSSLICFGLSSGLVPHLIYISVVIVLD
jgi:hypothetical protein